MTIYVDSNASGADSGNSWTDAYATLQQALDDAGALTEEIWVHAGTTQHSEASASITFTSSQADSDVAPIFVFGVDNADDSYVSAVGGGHGGLQFEASAQDILNTANIVWSGIHIKSTDDFFINTAAATNHYYDCNLVSGTAAGDDFNVGENNNSVHFENCTIAAGGKMDLVGKIMMRGCTYTSNNTTSAFTTGNGHQVAYIESCDLTGVGSPTSIVLGSSSGMGDVFFNNCDMPTTWTGAAGTFDEHGRVVQFNNCDDSSDYPRTEHYYKGGDVKTDTGVYITTSGWSDETANSTGTPLSHKMTPNSGLTLMGAYRSIPINAYIDTTGSKTFTVELIDDFETTLQDDEVWLELSYHDTSSQVAHVISSTRVPFPGDAANLSAGTGTGNWTGEPASSRSVKVATTVTVNNIGLYEAVVKLAKYEANGADTNPGAALYVAPLLTIS